MKPRFSRRMSLIKASAIREILKVTERPDILSFAGGLPAPESFPMAELAVACQEALTRDGGSALQYGPTEGLTPLRAWIAEQMARRGHPCTVEQVLVTAGSQQGLDLVGKIFLDPGDTVVVESPSYLAALQAFEAYEAKFAVVGSDDHGMRVDELAALLETSAVKPKFIYLVPTFQNPKGTTLSLERRQVLSRLAAEHGVTVLEDDPYGELRYSGERLPTVASLDLKAPVIYLSSFSKTLAPGLRLGWAVASPEIIRALVIAKQAADLHTGTLSQRAAFRLLETFDFEAHLQRIRALYGTRRDAMLAAVARHFPAGSTWTKPDGGLFVWAKLPAGIDTQLLLDEAVHEKVAFVPGAPFHPGVPDRTTMRLNFSNRPPELIAEGMERLGRAIARQLQRSCVPPAADDADLPVAIQA